MGRIKSTLVKRTSKQLLQNDLQFTDKFNDNKKVLGSTMPSKKMRNKIAGYIAHVLRMKNDLAKREERRAKRAAAVVVQAPAYSE